jgi:DNA-binding winged helix-turn-helix (wHTH) protein/TolB-like protein
MDGAHSSAVFCFGEFELDTHNGELCRGGNRIPLQEQPLAVLSVLLQNAGTLVRREDLRRQVWPENTYVEFDHALNTAVKKIRIALGESADEPRYIETIPKRGYRFIAPVIERSVVGDGLAQVGLASSDWMPRKRMLSLAVVSVLLLCVGLLGMRWRSGTDAAEAGPIVLSVLPLQDLSDDSSGGPLGDGLGDELTMQLGRASPAKIAVTSRAAALTYRHTGKNVAEVAQELHAAYLLDGTIRGNSRRVRVCMELIRTSDELQIWGDSFDRDEGDALALERELSSTISSKVKDALAGETGRGKVRP